MSGFASWPIRLTLPMPKCAPCPPMGWAASFGSSWRERLETQERTNRALMYRVFGEIADPPDEVGYAPVLADKLCARLRVAPRRSNAA